MRKLFSSTSLCGIITAWLLVSCSGTGSCPSDVVPTPTPTPPVASASLQLTAPNLYPAGVALEIPVVLTNNGSSVITLSDYDLNIIDDTTHGDATITPTSKDSCNKIALQNSCTLKVAISASSIPGSFSVEATPKSSENQTLVLDKIKLALQKNSLKQDKITVKVSTGLVEVPANSATGIAGITLYYPSSVLRNQTGATNVIVTAVVSSANAGNFDTIDLIDTSGNKLSYTVLTGNSGANFTNLSKGSVVSLSVRVPDGVTQLLFKTQLSEDGIVRETSQNANLIQIIDNNNGIGIANILPNYFSLTESRTTQLITLSNTGNASLTNINITPNDAFDILDNGCSTELAPNNQCIFKVLFKNVNQPIKGTGNVEIGYNDGVSAASSTATINYIGRNASAGMSIVSGTNPNFDFTTTTNTPISSTLVTITNTGDNVESNIQTSSLPAGFSFSTSGITQAPCGSRPFSLNAGESCNIYLIYNNATPTPSASANISLSYNYLTTNGVSQRTSDVISVTYQTVQSRAALVIYPAAISFGTILNNNVESQEYQFAVLNSGDNTATNVALSIAESYFTQTSACGSSLLAGESCLVTVKFGPVNASVASGMKVAYLKVNYVPFTNESAVDATAIAMGQIATARSAILTVAESGLLFAGGIGIESNPYQIQQNTISYLLPRLLYTVTNTGAVNAQNVQLNGVFGGASDWNLVGTSCNGITLSPNAACTVEMQLKSSAVAVTGAHNLGLSTVTLSWVDENNPNGESQIMGGTSYVNVYPVPKITIAPESATISAPGESTTFTASLVGGYNVGNNTISIAASVATESIIVTSTPNPCILNSSVTSCSFKVATLSSIVASDYVLNVTNSSNVVLDVNQLNLKVESPAASKMIFITNAGTTGSIGGLSGADAFCQLAATGGSKTSSLGATWKALLRGNNATTIGTTYVTTMNETIAKATTNDLVASGATNNTLQHEINRTENGVIVSNLAWTGGKGTNTNTDNCANWTNATNAKSGSYGASSSTTIWWNYKDQYTPAGYTQSCDNNQSLYCVQQ